MSEGFLGRWSRRKAEVRDGREPVDPPSPEALPPSRPAAAAPGAAPAAPPIAASPRQAPEAAGHARAGDAPPAPTLADAQALTPASDFRPFVSREVAPEVRNAAMKKLFADPHFNVMDGLDVYIDDYNRPDPLPAAMLRELASARFLGLVEDEPAVAQPDGQAPAPAVARDDADAPSVPDVAQSEAIDSPTDHVRPNPDLQLQPDDAARREGVGPGPG